MAKLNLNFENRIIKLVALILFGVLFSASLCNKPDIPSQGQPRAQQGRILVRKGSLPQQTSTAEHTAPAATSIEKYSINLMWINTTSDPDRKYISSAKSADEFKTKVIIPVCKWAKSNPGAAVILWYDSFYTTPASVTASRQILDSTLVECGNLHAQLRDIREIPIVHMNPDVFSDQTPVYFRVDLLKPIIIVDSIERGKNDAAIYTDLEVGDLRKDGGRMGKDELFKPSVMQELSQVGLVLGVDAMRKTENQFFQLVRNERMIEAIKVVVVNINFIRAITALNEKRSNATEEQLDNPLYQLFGPVGKINALPFLSMINNLFPYYNGLAGGEPVKVLARLVEPDAKEGDWIDYHPRKHGYVPLGIMTSRDTTPVSEYNGKLFAYWNLLRNPKNFNFGSRNDLDVKAGSSHPPLYVSRGKANAADGVYRYHLWD